MPARRAPVCVYTSHCQYSAILMQASNQWYGLVLLSSSTFPSVTHTARNNAHTHTAPLAIYTAIYYYSYRAVGQRAQELLKPLSDGRRDKELAATAAAGRLAFTCAHTCTPRHVLLPLLVIAAAAVTSLPCHICIWAKQDDEPLLIFQCGGQLYANPHGVSPPTSSLPRLPRRTRSRLYNAHAAVNRYAGKRRGRQSGYSLFGNRENREGRTLE